MSLQHALLVFRDIVVVWHPSGFDSNIHLPSVRGFGLESASAAASPSRHTTPDVANKSRLASTFGQRPHYQHFRYQFSSLHALYETLFTLPLCTMAGKEDGAPTHRSGFILKLKNPSFSNGDINSASRRRLRSNSRTTSNSPFPQQCGHKMKRARSGELIEGDMEKPEPRKRVRFEEPMDVNTAVEEGRANEEVDAESDDDDSVDNWPLSKVSKIRDIFKSGKSNNGLLNLAPNEIRGVNLLQLRLEYTMQNLLETYKERHDGEELAQSTIKKAFTNAFNDAAKQNGVPVEDLKRVYNRFTKGSKTRKLRGTLDGASKPTGVVRRSTRPQRAARDTTPAVPMPRKERMPRKRTVKDEIIGAPEAPITPAFEMSEGEIAVQKRLTQARATGVKVPQLPFYHSLVRALSEKCDFESLRTSDLREINHIGRAYSVEELVLALNCLFPGRATTEKVRELVENCREEMVLNGIKEYGYDRENDMFLPKER
ncbi:hypothetical protein M409DRAFT_55581 [Zasmidium cellare ATCC 36951]|uniref:Uncharacterized protein n=1 Tax=Zasmidium cellare ATCC 36951 TaxID=1080233 RepID=A0A6A6CEZ2_ZASCE|nr:uncharacterized protein M409DRAFT_55581 [Zasmidium cellare ATCC 36951]KAF2165695.1 hypothetical protein M409DRAFT_55581 [Zasmidium cellare ATCC 36951]